MGMIFVHMCKQKKKMEVVRQKQYRSFQRQMLKVMKVSCTFTPVVSVPNLKQILPDSCRYSL